MTFVGIILAGFSGWILAEFMSRQSSDVVVAIAAFVIGSLGGFAISIGVMFIFDFLEELPIFDWSIIWAGNGTLFGSLAGAVIGSLNGRRAAKRVGR